MSERNNIFIYLLYLLTLSFSYFYVNSVLKDGNIVIERSQRQAEAVEVKPVKVTLGIGSNFYKVRLKNTDTAYDLIDEVWGEYGVLYEKTDYTDGIGIDNIGGIKAQDGYRWRLFSPDSRDVTDSMESVKLTDNDVYYLSQVKY